MHKHVPTWAHHRLKLGATIPSKCMNLLMHSKLRLSSQFFVRRQRNLFMAWHGVHIGGAFRVRICALRHGEFASPERTGFITHHVLSQAAPSLQHSVTLGGCPSGHRRLVQAAQRLEASSSQRSPRYWSLCLEARQSDVAKARLKVPTRAAVPYAVLLSSSAPTSVPRLKLVNSLEVVNQYWTSGTQVLLDFLN